MWPSALLLLSSPVVSPKALNATTTRTIAMFPTAEFSPSKVGPKYSYGHLPGFRVTLHSHGHRPGFKAACFEQAGCGADPHEEHLMVLRGFLRRLAQMHAGTAQAMHTAFARDASRLWIGMLLDQPFFLGCREKSV